MKLNLLVATALFATTTSSFAQSAFEGAYGQVGVGYQSSSPSVSNATEVIGGTTYNSNVSSGTSTGFAGTVTVGYYAPINKDFLLGIGAEYSPFATSKATSNTSAVGLMNGSATYQTQNSYNIFLSPAMMIDKDKMVYAKVGYTGTSVKSQSTTAGDTAASYTQNYQGYSLGLGYRQVIQGGFYGFAEGNYFSYGNKNVTTTGNFGGTNPYTYSYTSNVNAYNFLVGLGYKF